MLMTEKQVFTVQTLKGISVMARQERVSCDYGLKWHQHKYSLHYILVKNMQAV